jgi:hypothetical protein
MSNCRGIVIFALLAFAFTVTGDEGMWTLNNLPAEKLKQQYGQDLAMAVPRALFRRTVY